MGIFIAALRGKQEAAARFFFCLLFFQCVGQAAPTPGEWTWRNPLPTGNALYSIAYGKDGFVAVGRSGTIIRSAQSDTWEAVNSGSLANLLSVACGKDCSVAVGDQIVLISQDGAVWVPANLQPVVTLQGVAFGSSVFVTVGRKGTIYTSENGKDWTPSNDSGSGSDFFAVAYGAGIFVAVGVDVILVSSDGFHWSHANYAADSVLGGVIYGDGRFIATGSRNTVFSSIDGVNWVQEDNTNLLARIYFADGLFVGGTWEGATFTSHDATNWLGQDEFPAVAGIASGGGIFVVIGGASIITSRDGATWSHADTGPTAAFTRAIYAKNAFVVIAPEGIALSSTDATEWEEHSIAPGVNDIAYGHNMFVAVGGSSWVGDGYRPRILVSRDLDNWMLVTNVPFVPGLNRVTFGSGLFVGVGDGGTILTSRDALNWRVRSSGIDSRFFCMTYGRPAVFVGFAESVYTEDAGFLDPVVTSHDGLNWTSQLLSTGQWIFDVCWGGGKYVAVGEWGTILTSIDAVNWTSEASPTSSWLFGVAYGNGRFVATGGNVILSSTNGMAWSVQVMPVVGYQNSLNGVAFGKDSFIAVGNYGTVFGTEAPMGVGRDLTRTRGGASRMRLVTD